jgi:hypothetical protein
LPEGDVEEICDHFAGDWPLVSVRGSTEAELNAGEPARITFWEDGTGEVVCAGVHAILDADYGETLEGLPAIQFKGRRSAGEKRSTVSGLGAIRRGGKKLEGSLKIGGRARAFVAKRLP